MLYKHVSYNSKELNLEKMLPVYNHIFSGCITKELTANQNCQKPVLKQPIKESNIDGR